MKNTNNTKGQLIGEVNKLNDKIDELEKSKNERNRPIDTMQESEQKFKALVESARDGIIVIQNDVIKFANPHASEIYGASLNNVIGQSFLKFVHTDSVGMIEKRYANWRSGKKVPNFFKVDLINSNREKRICEINSSTIVFDGQPSELVIIHDITERKKAEEAIRESEEKYRTIFENTGTATIIIEENMIISVANAKFLDLTGYSREEIEGQKSWTEFVIPEDLERMKKQHKLRRKNSNAALINYEFKMINRNNEIKDILLTVDMIPGTKKSVASLLDITEHKQAEEKLKSRNKELETWAEVTTGRELKMLELKKEINELLEKSGEKPKYEIPI